MLFPAALPAPSRPPLTLAQAGPHRAHLPAHRQPRLAVRQPRRGILATPLSQPSAHKRPRLISCCAVAASRVVYNSFASTSSFPGNLWVNVFFVLAFVFAIAAGIYQAPTTCPRRPACSPCVVNADTPLRRCAGAVRGPANQAVPRALRRAGVPHLAVQVSTHRLTHGSAGAQDKMRMLKELLMAGWERFVAWCARAAGMVALKQLDSAPLAAGSVSGSTPTRS